MAEPHECDFAGIAGNKQHLAGLEPRRPIMHGWIAWTPYDFYRR
jgi:hypothetical protein